MMANKKDRLGGLGGIMEKELKDYEYRQIGKIVRCKRDICADREVFLLRAGLSFYCNGCEDESGSEKCDECKRENHISFKSADDLIQYAIEAARDTAIKRRQK